MLKSIYLNFSVTEDADELAFEGVTNTKRTGHKVSKVMSMCSACGERNRIRPGCYGGTKDKQIVIITTLV